MPSVEFDTLPDDARLWVFAAERALSPRVADALLREVDAFLTDWSAHGAPLRCAREWRHDQFLAIGVDQSTAGASGCSIDGLFRVLQLLRRSIGANLLPGNRVYWRDDAGSIRGGQRSEFTALAARGEVSGDTTVFDTSIAAAADWRSRFERPARETWHARLIAAAGKGESRGGRPTERDRSPA
jgi:hypothetical protein